MKTKVGKTSKVIGIILAYKHAAFIPGLYKKLPHKLLDEVIITNDDSGDETPRVAKRLGIPIFTHPQLGYGGNLKYGLKKALARGATHLVEIHGDGQYDPAFIAPALLKMQKEGCDLVLATRFIDPWQPLRDQMPLIKYVANIGLSALERFILGVNVSEFHTGARIYSRRAIEHIALSETSNNFLFGFESIAQIAFCGMKIGEVPGRSYYGNEHTSISLKNSVIYAFQSFRVIVLFILARLRYKTKLFSCPDQLN